MASFFETEQSSPSRLVLSGVIDGASPDEVYASFVDGSLITDWWPDSAEIDGVVGGSYTLQWPAMGWVLRGVYTELEPGHVIGFTWSWDHEPKIALRQVRVVLAPSGSATTITVTHGDYGPADGDERSGHIEGWQHFLGRLSDTFGR